MTMPRTLKVKYFFSVPEYATQRNTILLSKVQLAAGRNSTRQRDTASGNSPKHNKQCEVILQYHNSTRNQGKSNGIKLEEYEDNHFFLVFDLTATEEASKNFKLFPELIGYSLTLSCILKRLSTMLSSYF